MLGIPSLSIATFLKIRKHALHAYSVGLLQGKAYRTLERHLIETLDWYGLSINEWKLLGQLVDNQTLSRDQLAKRLDITTAVIEKLEKKLAGQKLLFSKKSSLKITKKGKELILLTEVGVKEKMQMLLAGLTRRELFTYMKVLTRIVDNG